MMASFMDFADIPAKLSIEDKHYSMKQFINATREYRQTKAEDISNLINRHLQLLSVTIDLSIFDPHTSIVAEFFVSLYELLSSLESRSTLAWCCVSVLSVACRNPAARKALIHTYQFLPSLSKLLGDQLTVEKKLRLLSLMQELTCGIRISWQIPHLPYLMATLSRWVESENEEVVALSLGVLVNLCYRNLPAIYTLTRCVDIKLFVRTCSQLQGLKAEVHVCKLLIILDYMDGNVPREAFFKLINVTFKSLIEAFKAKDSILLRHIVEFFLDVRKINQIDVINNFDEHDLELQQLLNVVENLPPNESGERAQQDPECMSLVFEFLHSLIELKIPKMRLLYPRLIDIALEWIQTPLVCSQAIAILRTIAVNTEAGDTETLEPLLRGLPIFMSALDNMEEVPSNIDQYKQLGALMQLLRVLVETGNTRQRVLNSLSEKSMYKVVAPLLGTSSPRTNSADTFSAEAIILYVNAIALIDEIARHNNEWVNVNSTVLQQKQVQMILAQAFYGSSKEIKGTILRMASNYLFPVEQVALAMIEVQPYAQAENKLNDDHHIAESLCLPITSIAQLERLDEIISRLKECIKENNVANIATSEVMELYDYKLSSMGHSERAAMASVEAASERCTHLQHRTAQLTAELSRLHQLLFHTQQCHEEASKSREELTEANRELNNRLETERGKHNAIKSQLFIKEKSLTEKEQQLEVTTKSLASAEEQVLNLKQLVSKLEENISRKDKSLDKKEEMLIKTNVVNETLKIKITQLEKQLKDTETDLTNKSTILDRKSQELLENKKLMDTITQLMMKNKK